MTGVLEVDSAGSITSTTTFELYPPGPILGVPNSALLGQHIGAFLPGQRPAAGGSNSDGGVARAC